MTTTGVRSSACVVGSACGSGVVASAAAILLLAVPEVDQANDDGEHGPADRGCPHVWGELAARVHEQRVAHQLWIQRTGVELEHHPHPLRLVVGKDRDAVEDAG